MQRPTDAIEKAFNKDGIYFLDYKSIEDLKAAEGGRYMGVNVEIGLPPGISDLINIDFTISVVSPRAVAMFMTDWEIIERGGVRHLAFQAWQQIPTDIYPAGLYPYTAMTFMDLCFYAGNESIPDSFGEDVLSKLNPAAVKADLGWIMPVRFADLLILALGKLNDSVLSGMLKESVIYGIHTL